MGKLFGVVVALIAIISAYPIVAHWYVQPIDISTHGHAIDEQLADTLAEAGLSFLGAQLHPGVEGRFGPLHPDKIDEGNANFFGLDPANDLESRDDIVSAELDVPVNHE